MDTKPKKNVRMKAARALKGLSQEDLAKAAGVTRPWMACFGMRMGKEMKNESRRN